MGENNMMDSLSQPPTPLPHPLVTPEQIEDYERDGAVVVRGIFKEWIDIMADGIAQNMASPSEYASENQCGEGEGRFFDDYCNWTRLPAIERVVRHSPAAALAAHIMQSQTAQFFHDHVLVKEANTLKATPWHMDSPYYFVEGAQTVSMWIPLDAVHAATEGDGEERGEARGASLRFIAGSHKWERQVRPVSWADDSDFYDHNNNGGEGSNDRWMDVPDPDNAATPMPVLEFSLEPGDAVLFHFRTAHGARGNASSTSRRRALSLRWVGDDARYCCRPGRTSPPFPGHGMVAGQKLRTDWFPVLYSCKEEKEEEE